MIYNPSTFGKSGAKPFQKVRKSGAKPFQKVEQNRIKTLVMKMK
jgi:hypothetical protein